MFKARPAGSCNRVDAVAATTTTGNWELGIGSLIGVGVYVPSKLVELSRRGLAGRTHLGNEGLTRFSNAPNSTKINQNGKTRDAKHTAPEPKLFLLLKLEIPTPV